MQVQRHRNTRFHLFFANSCFLLRICELLKINDVMVNQKFFLAGNVCKENLHVLVRVLVIERKNTCVTCDPTMELACCKVSLATFFSVLLRTWHRLNKWDAIVVLKFFLAGKIRKALLRVLEKVKNATDDVVCTITNCKE